MKKIILILFVLISTRSFSQVFIDKGMIEYEVKSNNYKLFGDGIWAEMMKDKLPKFTIKYFQLTFAGNKSVYKYNRIDDKNKLPWGNEGDEDNLWYNDYEQSDFVQLKNVFGDNYLLTDSLVKIDWKITNESREIAGFNCRKAVGRLFDSVYVFAFYTDEITVSGGPMGLHGLPGMIMGITIPRMFTSWLATKVSVNGIDEKLIAAPTKGRKKIATELRKTVEERTKNWGTWGQQAVWNIFL